MLTIGCDFHSEPFSVQIRLLRSIVYPVTNYELPSRPVLR